MALWSYFNVTSNYIWPRHWTIIINYMNCVMFCRLFNNLYRLNSAVWSCKLRLLDAMHLYWVWDGWWEFACWAVSSLSLVTGGFSCEAVLATGSVWSRMGCSSFIVCMGIKHVYLGHMCGLVFSPVGCANQGNISIWRAESVLDCNIDVFTWVARLGSKKLCMLAVCLLVCASILNKFFDLFAYSFLTHVPWKAYSG